MSELCDWNVLKFGTSREINSQEGLSAAEGLLVVPPNRSEVVTPQVELDGAVGEVPILQPPMKCVRTKLIF